MGTDIHLRVEYLAPAETVALREGEIRVVETDSTLHWVPAEKITRKEDDPHNKFYLDRLDDPGVKEEWDAMPAWDILYEDRWYTGRDYSLFGALASVRRESPWGWWPQGLPEDMSDEVEEESGRWGVDGHSHSYQSLAELLAPNWADVSVNGEWFELLERLKDLAFTKCGGDQTHVRIVYWFDN